MVKIFSMQRACRSHIEFCRKMLGLGTFLALFLSNYSLAAPFDPSGWHRFREIRISPQMEAGPVGTPLESSVLEHTKPDLADVRVVSSEGHVVPVTVTDSLHNEEPVPFPGALFKVLKRQGKWTDVWIDKKAKILTRGVMLQTSSKDFARKIEIRGSDTGIDTYVILMDGLICDLPGSIPVRSLELFHPLNNFRYIQLRILDGELPPLKVEGAFCFPAVAGGPATRSAEVRIVENRMNASDNSTVIIADLGEKRFPLAGIKISTPTKSFAKRVRMLQGSSDSPDSWKPFYEGTFFRIEMADAAKENLEARFQPQTGRYLMLELTGGGPVVTVNALDAKEAMRFAVFPYRPGLTYRLFYDNPQAEVSSIGDPQPTAILNHVLATSSGVSLGNERKNVVPPPPRPIRTQQSAYPTTVGKLLGMAMLLIGLLLLFAVMLRARSQRRAERRRGSRLFDSRF